MGDIYKNIQDYNPNKKRYSDIIADMRRNKKVKPIVFELLIRGRTLNIFLVFFFHKTSFFCTEKY